MLWRARSLADHAHVVVKLLAMLRLAHVNKVDHDNASHVAEAQLARYLVGGLQVDVERVRLLVGARFAAVSRVDIDHMEGLRALDDQISPAFKGDGLAETALYLAGDVEIVENRNILGIKLYDILVFGSDEGNVVLNLREGLRLVDVDVLEVRGEHVADHADRSGILLIDEGRSL